MHAADKHATSAKTRGQKGSATEVVWILMYREENRETATIRGADLP